MELLLAADLPAGSSTACDDPATTGVVETCNIGDTFSTSVDDFATLVVDIAPYLFAGLVSVLLIRLAIKWFSKVARSV